MLIAVVATLLHKDIVSYEWIARRPRPRLGIGTAISLDPDDEDAGADRVLATPSAASRRRSSA
jgi:hypothetical protein